MRIQYILNDSGRKAGGVKMNEIKPDSIMRTPWAYDVPPFEMVPGLYYVGNTSVSSHLFDTGEGLLLLDTGYPQALYMLIGSIYELGLDPKNIRWILHTHAHVDHFGGTRMLVERYGCRTYLPAVDLPFMTEQPDLNYAEMLGLPYNPPGDTWFKTDVAVHPGDVLHFGKLTVTCHSAAGHTPGTMAYVFKLPCGLKAVMHGGIGLNTLKSSYANRFGLGDSWRKEYAASIARLRGLEADVVLGNHPAQSDTFGKLARRTPEHNPFVDPTEWERFLDGAQERYDALLKDDPL